MGRIFAFNLHLLHLIKIIEANIGVFCNNSAVFAVSLTVGNYRLKIQYGHTEIGVSVAILILESELHGLAGKIFLYHKRNLEGDRVIEFTQIESGQLADLFKSVNERVSVYEKLAGCF